MNLFNTSICIFFLSTCIYSNGIYSHASQLPYYNRLGCLSLINWLTRSKYQRYNKNRSIRSISIRNDIRINLFTQIMSENHFGFNCGQIFPVIKYKYVEIFLMNFQLVILFYKKIIMK
uniref:Uncharacterized protein LOC113796600 n=1 Tax=Dermatophagoides pteronyssinus TaxID=6956 RepID=A0A6P6YDC9_DERPT|nr:uncharacterized protein LOC113796600 [Dermatophagoides pteronyssinus]